ncbi:hypothetical protein JCM10914_6395 [Paenibacillus sp. JCM 10914]|nr:hypothetical protein JCM10914_6395 [Paenibacillus sp. JCM 10914]
MGVESIGTTDNFFELGGDSIKAIQIASKFNNGSQSIQVRHILSHQTIVDICQFVKIQTLEKMYDQAL